MCLGHYLIEEYEIKRLNNLGENIQYRHQCSIIGIWHSLTKVKAIEYILEHYLSSFEYYGCNVRDMINDLKNISEDDKKYLIETFKLGPHKVDYENFDVNFLEKCFDDYDKSEEEFFSEIVLNVNDTQLREFINWFGDNCEFYCTKHVFSSIIDRCYKANDLETIKYTWDTLKNKL